MKAYTGYKMSKQTKMVAATIIDRHARGAYLRDMISAELAAEAFKKQSLKQREKADKSLDE
jgi:hypothetical protein